MRPFTSIKQFVKLIGMGNTQKDWPWAKLLKQKRRQLGETQAEFGKRFGVSFVAVSYWEAGKRDIPGEVTWWLSEHMPRYDRNGEVAE